jgi:hypothetical protein
MISYHGVLGCAVLLVGTALASTSASAIVVDYSDAAPLSDFDPLPQSFGDTPGTADFSYRTLNTGNNWGSGATVLAPHVEFWNGFYSGDDAIFAADSGSAKFELRIDAAAGLQLTGIEIDFGGWPNVDHTVEYRLFDAGWNSLGTDASFTILGATIPGNTIALALNTTSFVLQFGDDWNAGVNEVRYTVGPAGPVSAVPVPGALVLLGTGLAGLIGFGRRRKTAA